VSDRTDDDRRREDLAFWRALLVGAPEEVRRLLEDAGAERRYLEALRALRR
jgi:hypothetical protein